MPARRSNSAGSPSIRAGRRSSGEQPAKLSEHELRLLEHVAVGVGAELVTARVGLAGAALILLPGVAQAVVDVAVELDRDPLVRPAAVDPPPARHAVGLRQRQAAGLQQLPEGLLELAEAHVRVTAQD